MNLPYQTLLKKETLDLLKMNPFSIYAFFILSYSLKNAPYWPGAFPYLTVN